jgi:hypothetical protein
MIFQNFNKGGTERVYFGQFEYPAGADLIFDFGNPLSYSNTNAHSASNAATGSPAANVTASFVSYNNPGVIWPTYSSTNGGTMLFSYVQAIGSNYMQWDWKSTANQTNVVVYKPNGTQIDGEGLFPGAAGANSIELKINNRYQQLHVDYYNSSNSGYLDVFTPTLNTGSLNGQNGFNVMTLTADSGSNHNLYINANSSSFDSTLITRTTSGTQTTQFGVNSNSRIMAFLQYPRILKPAEIRQIYKVFSQRFFI